MFAFVTLLQVLKTFAERNGFFKFLKKPAESLGQLCE
jgi:hypothetical protein